MIRGPSGGGKTTMLNLIGSIDSSTSGELHIMQNRIDKDSTDEFLSDLRLRHIGFVF
jgi:putative ABC transport system ATP-binding protein